MYYKEIQQVEVDEQRSYHYHGDTEPLFFFRSSTLTCCISFLYINFLRFIFFAINFNHFLIKFHKPDLLAMINGLARNFSRKILCSPR